MYGLSKLVKPKSTGTSSASFSGPADALACRYLHDQLVSPPEKRKRPDRATWQKECHLLVAFFPPSAFGSLMQRCEVVCLRTVNLKLSEFRPLVPFSSAKGGLKPSGGTTQAMPNLHDSHRVNNKKVSLCWMLSPERNKTYFSASGRIFSMYWMGSLNSSAVGLNVGAVGTACMFCVCVSSK